MAFSDPALEARLAQRMGKASTPSGSIMSGSQFRDPALEQRLQQRMSQPRQQKQQSFQPIAQAAPIIVKPKLDPKKEALKFGANTALNLASTISKATQFATSTIGKQLLDTITKKNPVTAIASLAVPKQYKKLNDQWKDYIRKNEQKLPAAQVTKAVEKLSKNEYLQPSREWQQAQQTDWKQLFTKEHLPETILQVSPSIVSSILTAITVGPSGLFVTTAGSTAQDVKSDAMNFGVPEGKAETLGLATGLVVGYLDKALPDKLFGDPAVKQAFLKGMLRKLGNSVLLEAGTETTQEAVQLAAEKTFRNDLGWDEVAVRTALSAFGGALGGGAMQTVASVLNRTREEVINDDQTMLDYLKETKGSSTLTPQQAIGTIVGTPLENTPEGKAVIKTALEAQEQSKQVKITTSEGSVKAEIVEATQPVIEENKQLIQEELAKIQPEESRENQDNTALTSEGKSSEEISVPSRVISSTPGTLEKVDDFLSKIAARSISFSTKTLKISPSDLKKAGNLLMSITENPSQLVEVYTRVKQVSNEYEDLLGTLPGNPQIQIDIKTPESMVSKVIRNNLQGKKNYTLKDVNDALRGRAIYETEAEIEEVKNTWETAPYIMNYFDTPHYTGYRGLHYGLNFDGQMAEVQIHTPVSLKLDEILRPIYEAYRTSTEGIPIKIIESMRKVADSFYAESITEAEANDQISELLAQKQQKTVEKPKVAAKKATKEQPAKAKQDPKNELKKVYTDNQEAVEQAFSEVWQELDVAEAGSRVVVDGKTTGIKSTFPSWVPSEMRDRKVFDEVLAKLADFAAGDVSYPPQKQKRLRELLDLVLDEVDDRTGIDTRDIRNKIMEESDEKRKPNKENKESVSSSNERSEKPKPERAIEVKKEPEVVEGRVIVDPSKIKISVFEPMVGANPTNKYSVQVRYNGLAADEQRFDTREEAEAFAKDYEFEGLNPSVMPDYAAFAKKWGINPNGDKENGITKTEPVIKPEPKALNKPTSPVTIESLQKLRKDQLNLRKLESEGKITPEELLSKWNELEETIQDGVKQLENKKEPEAKKAADENGPLLDIENDISFSEAAAAHNGTSFTPDTRAKSEIASYVSTLTEDYKDLKRFADTPEKEAMLDELFAKYRNGFKARVKDSLRARSGLMSAMITGPANFPIRRNTKRFEAHQRKIDEEISYRNKMIRRIENELNPTIIASNDPEAVTKLKEKLAKLESDHAKMVEINKILRSKKDVTNRIVALGMSKETAEKMQEKDFAGRVGIPSYMLTNSNAKIKATKKRLETMIKVKNTTGSETSFDGGKVILNPEIYRLQIKYDAIPDYNKRDLLKKSGFKWSPKNQAWQRQLSSNAIRATENLLGIKVKRLTSNSSGSSDANVDTFQDLPIITNERRADRAVTVPFPEMIALANELMNKYPTVHVKPGKKFGGQVNGMFLSRGDGEIRLNAALFTDVNQAAKTLAHEMGHLADYIPDQTLKRGNLLGRIGSMHKFMRGFFTNVEVEEEIDTLVAERKATQEARKLLPPKESRSSADKEKDKGYLADIRQINKEIKKLQENAIKNKDVFKELWKLSKQWRPLQQQQTMINVATGKPEIVTVEITEEQADDEYLSYRKSSRELYADALSVLLNDPARIRESAPTFWSKFIEQLDRKPILKENLFATWDLLNEPQDVILERRLNQIYKGYSAAKAKRADILSEQKPKRSFIERVMQNHITVFDPIYRKLDKKFKEAGVVTSPKAKLRMQLEEMQMRRNESYLYIDSIIQDINTPLKEIGLSEDDLGALLQLERGLGDRKDIANPYGLQGNFSQETLDYLQTYLQKHRSISKDQFNVLQQVAKKFREYTFSKVEAAAEVGVYSQKFFLETAKPNKDTYATYQVIEYIHDNYVSAGIKHAVGTVKPIENPVVSTLLKTMAVIEQVELQKGKLAVIDELRTNFPGDISDAKAIRPQGVRVGWRQEKNRVSLEYYKDGAKAAVNVDPYIAQMFEVYTPTEMHTAVQVSSAFNRLFKPLVTTYNLSWGFYSNIIRDTKRTYKNLGAILPKVGKKQGISIFEYMYRWVNSIPEGRNFQKHKITPLLKEMLANKAFSMPFTGYDSMANEAEWIKPIIKRYAPLGDDAKQTSFKSKMLRPITKIFKGIEYVGSIMETTSKVAGYQIVKKRLESGREAGYITRNYVGTPNYIDGGTQKQIDNNIFVFSNVMLQALRNDIEIATNPTTKSGYWFKTMQVDILPKLIMLAGAAGLFGEIVKELYSKATEYDKTNYIIVPLGMRANGKASYLRIPQDETGRLFSAIVWKLGTYMTGDLKKPEQIAQLGAGFIPSLTPLWTIGGGWLNYVQGRNPYDDYRGRLVIDDTTWSAGGLPRITKMVQWTLGSAGIWQFNTYDDASDTTTDYLLKNIPVINRALKSTDYGLTEKEKQVEQELDKQSAKRIMKERASLQDAINKTRSNPDQKYEVGKQLIKDVLGETIENSTDKRRRTNLIKKYEIGLLRGSVSREMDSLIEADTNAYKLELLKLYKRTLPASEYYNLKKTAVDNKVISDDLRKEYLKMGL